MEWEIDVFQAPSIVFAQFYPSPDSVFWIMVSGSWSKTLRAVSLLQTGGCVIITIPGLPLRNWLARSIWTTYGFELAEAFFLILDVRRSFDAAVYWG